MNRYDFKRIFESYGVEIIPEKGSSHFKCRKVVDGERRVYPVPLIKGKNILDVYVKGARRRFKLTKEDGVSDEEFFSR